MKELSPKAAEFALTEAALSVVQVAREAKAWRLELVIKLKMDENDDGIATIVVVQRAPDGTYDWMVR